MHTAQIEKFAAAEHAEPSRSGANGSHRDEAPAGGSLASDEQLAALREKLAGNSA
jgi:small subunit ribosomal protein S1